jgi:glycosyltransferase involved in cell wall biosynthesis
LNYSGWQRKLLEENAAGPGGKLCDVDEFAEKVVYFHDNRGKLAEMGRNSRRLAEEEFDRNKLAQQALDTISDTTRHK